MILTEWARAWGVPAAAMADLRGRLMGLDAETATVTGAVVSEAQVQAQVRVEASVNGMRVWRNNIGSYEDPKTGRWIRYGLANDSAAVNNVCKSADLIGVRPRLIQLGDVGKVIGQFVSFECKRADWTWANTERERAQGNWASLILSLGGEAKFVTGKGQI